MSECDKCDGFGTIWRHVECSACDGDGSIEFALHCNIENLGVSCTSCAGRGNFFRELTCHCCRGTGTSLEEEGHCQSCNGFGMVSAAAKSKEMAPCPSCAGSGRV